MRAFDQAVIVEIATSRCRYLGLDQSLMGPKPTRGGVVLQVIANRPQNRRPRHEILIVRIVHHSPVGELSRRITRTTYEPTLDRYAKQVGSRWRARHRRRQIQIR